MNTGPADAMIGALMLVVFAKPKKNADIFTVIPKKEETTISNIFFRVSCFKYFNVNGRNKKDAKKNLIKASVNGGIFSSENLKIGEAAPQIMFAMMRATIGFIKKFYELVFFLFMYTINSPINPVMTTCIPTKMSTMA